MTSNHIRAIVLFVAIILGVTIRFVWKGYKLAHSGQNISTSDEDNKPYFKIPKPTSLPTNTKIYSPPKKAWSLRLPRSRPPT